MKLVIVTGMSGAGKGTAVKIMETWDITVLTIFRFP